MSAKLSALGLALAGDLTDTTRFYVDLDGTSMAIEKSELALAFGGATSQSIYAGSVTVPTDDGYHTVSWDSLITGDPLVDISTPTSVTAATDGLYVVSATATADAPHAATFARLLLQLDFSSAVLVTPLDAIPGGLPAVGAGATSVIAAGNVIDIEIAQSYNGSVAYTLLISVALIV